MLFKSMNFIVFISWIEHFCMLSSSIELTRCESVNICNGKKMLTTDFSFIVMYAKEEETVQKQVKNKFMVVKSNAIICFIVIMYFSCAATNCNLQCTHSDYHNCLILCKQNAMRKYWLSDDDNSKLTRYCSTTLASTIRGCCGAPYFLLQFYFCIKLLRKWKKFC